MKTHLIFVTAFLLMTFANCTYAQDWPQFLGPERNSTSPQKNLYTPGPKTGLKFYGRPTLASVMADQL